MKSNLLAFFLFSTILSTGISCRSINLGGQGGAIGSAGGGLIGSVIGAASGNAEAGSLIGASLGESTGAAFTRTMDNQAEEIKKELPDATVTRTGNGIVVEFANKVLFGTGRYALTEPAAHNLDQLAKLLLKYPDTQIEIHGHTDDKGRENYNLALSQKRAQAVCTYLTNSSIPASRITVKGFGESAPKYSNLSDSGRLANRRVEFLISGIQTAKKEASKAGNQ